MEDVNRLLVDRCEGVNNCIFQKGGNLYVETARSDIPVIESTLREQYERVIHKKDADAFPAPLDGYIVVGLLVSDAPVDRFSDISVRLLEITGQAQSEEMIQAQCQAWKEEEKKWK